MAYGKNAPWGLQAVRTLTGALWNNQYNPYPIAEGYDFSIFNGDPVVLCDGVLWSLFDPNLPNKAGTSETAAILGVFVECSYTSPTSISPINPAGPGNSFWLANTLTASNTPIVGYVYDDLSIVYNVQCGDPGMIAAGIGNVFNLAVGAGAGGNTTTGQSGATLVAEAGANQATGNVKVRALVDQYSNNFNIPYNNVEVIIQNHWAASRPAGLGV